MTKDQIKLPGQDANRLPEEGTLWAQLVAPGDLVMWQLRLFLTRAQQMERAHGSRQDRNSRIFLILEKNQS